MDDDLTYGVLTVNEATRLLQQAFNGSERPLTAPESQRVLDWGSHAKLEARLLGLVLGGQVELIVANATGPLKFRTGGTPLPEASAPEEGAQN